MHHIFCFMHNSSIPFKIKNHGRHYTGISSVWKNSLDVPAFHIETTTTQGRDISLNLSSNARQIQPRGLRRANNRLFRSPGWNSPGPPPLALLRGDPRDGYYESDLFKIAKRIASISHVNVTTGHQLLFQTDAPVVPLLSRNATSDLRFRNGKLA